MLRLIFMQFDSVIIHEKVKRLFYVLLNQLSKLSLKVTNNDKREILLNVLLISDPFKFVSYK